MISSQRYSVDGTLDACSGSAQTRCKVARGGLRVNMSVSQDVGVWCQTTVILCVVGNPA